VRRAAGGGVRIVQPAAYAAVERQGPGHLAQTGRALPAAAGLLALLPARMPAGAHPLPVRHHAGGCHCGLEPQSAYGQFRSRRARLIVKTHPAPAKFRTVRVPPSASTLWRAMTRPKPNPALPSLRWEEKGVN